MLHYVLPPEGWGARSAGRNATSSPVVQTLGRIVMTMLGRELTPQELQVVKLASQGLTNRQIGEQLFLSPRTVGYHLYKAYPKLGVATRAELGRFHQLLNQSDD